MGSGPKVGVAFAGELPRMRAARLCLAVCLLAARAIPADAPPAPVAVRYPEGVVHGFLTLGTADGTVLADGDSIQYSRGDRVTNRLVFRFRDGSLQDETAVFRQRRTFELLTDHLVQKGPSFPRPIEVDVDRPSGRVTVKSTESGKEKTTETRMDLPADLANGIVATILKNLPSGGGETTMTIVAATPKPMLVTLGVSAEGEDRILVGKSPLKATRYVVRVKLSGIKGILAKLLGKKPPDTRVWVLRGEAPTFLRSEGPAFFGGPPWVIQLTSPAWPKSEPAPRR